MKRHSHDEVYAQSLEYFNGNELAAKVFVDKYALKDNDDYLELTPDDMHKRIAREFARIETKKFKQPLTYEEIYDLLKDYAYIIPQGSILYGLGNKSKYVSLSNCYVIPLYDSYGSILTTDQQIVQISKRRGGVGYDISNLRPEDMLVQNAAQKTSGAVSFLHRFSHSIREVGQNGRRGASLASISVHHPEILKFITIKNDETSVTGANISVRLTNEFLDAVRKDIDYELRWPVDSTDVPEVSKMISAKKVWKEIIHSAWLRAEPGLLFWDNIVNESPADCYENFQSCSTNPCCFSKEHDHWVLTKYGLKEIQNITSNDLVYVENVGWRKNSGYFSAGIHDVYEVKFENYQSTLYITKNHKLLKEDDQLTRLEDLNIGDTIVRHRINRLDDQIDFIKSIKHVGKHEVGCIEVPEHHQFVCNGIISGNSEIPLSPYDSCRLLAINLFNFVKEPFTTKAYFDLEHFAEVTKIAQRLMDNIIDLELECIDRILKKIDKDPEPDYVKQVELDLWTKIREACENGRRTGLGITALGDTLAAMGIKYGSKHSIETTGQIYQTLKLAAYRSSVDMAKELGPFPVWDHKKESENPFLLRIKDEDPTLYKDMIKWGRRNIALLTTAPTGTISTQASLKMGEYKAFGTTSGIEPCFLLSYTRRKKVNPNDKNAKVDFVDKSGDSWTEFEVYHGGLDLWKQVNPDKEIEKSPYHGACANDINWTNRVKLQAAAQVNLDHSVSSTLNLPNDVAEEEVSKIYETAWSTGLKGITVYRDGCRSGVLVKEVELPKDRPRVLDCDVYHISVVGNKYFVLVGLYKGRPYEVFAGKNGFLKDSITTGQIIRKRKDFYKAVFGDDDELSPITATMSEMEEVISRLTSSLLREGTPMYRIVRQLEKVGATKEISSFARGIARALKKYIPDGTKEEDTCPECGNDSLVRESGCPTCKHCGYSKCL